MILINLEEDKSLKKEFNQFEKSGPNTYNDAKYNSVIDESKIDAKTKEKAEKVEREILTDSSNTNVHIMEDRG